MKVRFEIKQKGKSSQTPIFLVHGDEANWLLPKYLHPSIPFYIFKHMGIKERQFPFTSLNEIARLYVKKLAAQYPKGYFILSGYSIGGVIAYEMAQQLKSTGRNFHLVLLDSKAPRLKSNYEYHNRQIRWNRSLISKIYLRYTKIIILAFYKLTNIKMSKKHFFYLRMQRYRKARRNYVIENYDSNLTLIKTLKDNFSQPNLGWSKYVKGHIFLYTINCNHHEITTEPYIQKLAKLLEQIQKRYNKKRADRSISKSSS
ncbi:MAG: thioesterase domain-containing protein [Chitinophagales bacterium]